MGFKYPADLYEVVRANWNARPFGIQDVPCPDEPSFLAVAEAVYHASMLTEEQNRISIKVMIGRPEDVAHFQADAQSLEPPIPLSPSALIKVAPAIDTTQSMLAVTNDQIWAIIDVGGGHARLNAGVGVMAFVPPLLLTVTSHQPGHLIVEQGDSLLVELAKGEVASPTPRRVFDEEPIASILSTPIETIRITREGLGGGPTDAAEGLRIARAMYERFVSMVLRIIRDRKHGGTILIVPPDSAARMWDNVSIKHSLNDDRVRDLFITHSDDIKDFVEKNADLANFVATLAGVDGAVVLNANLSVLGFGSRINSKGAGLVTGRIAGTTELWHVDSKGTRHSSAMKLCHDLEGCIAFVVSQDESVRVFAKLGGEVIVWPEMRL